MYGPISGKFNKITGQSLQTERSDQDNDSLDGVMEGPGRCI